MHWQAALKSETLPTLQPHGMVCALVICLDQTCRGGVSATNITSSDFACISASSSAPFLHFGRDWWSHVNAVFGDWTTRRLWSCCKLAYLSSHKQQHSLVDHGPLEAHFCQDQESSRKELAPTSSTTLAQCFQNPKISNAHPQRNNRMLII